MNRPTVFALVVLFSVSATAQQPASPRQAIEQELLELEQDVDKTVLREALLLQARNDLKGAPGGEQNKKQWVQDAVALRDFIDSKKHAIIARAAELSDKRVASRRVPTMALGPGVDPSARADRQAIIERVENAQVEAQLLQAQRDLLRSPLEKAVQNLAAAELEASHDETQHAKADAARKEYEKIKSRYVEYSKRLRLEQQGMQQMGGMGSFGAGMR